MTDDGSVEATADSTVGCIALPYKSIAIDVTNGGGTMSQPQPQQSVGITKSVGGITYYCPLAGTPTPSPTPTKTATPSVMPLQTATSTPTGTVSPSPTPTKTATPSVTPLQTATSTPTGTVSPSPTPTKTATPGLTATNTPVTPSPTATNTPVSPTPTQVSCTPDAQGSYGYESPPNNFVALVNHRTICPGVLVKVWYKPPSQSTSVGIQILMDKTLMPGEFEDEMVLEGDTWTYSFVARASAPCQLGCSQGAPNVPDTSLINLDINFVYVDGSGPHLDSVPFK